MRRVFLADRVFAAVFALLALTALSPLVFTPIVPAPDLHGNVAGASLLARLAIGDGAALAYYRAHWWPFPYWSVYALTGALGLLVGPLAAAKLVTGLLVIALPLAVLRLCIALGRDPRIPLWAFLLCWDHNILAGWHSFSFGMSAALFFLAHLLEARTRRDAWRTSVWSWVVGLSHPQAIGFGLLSALLLSFRGAGVRARLALGAIASSGMMAMVALWLVERRSKTSGVPFSLEYPSASDKVSQFAGFSIDVITGPFGEIASALGFLVLVLGTFATTLLPRLPLSGERRLAGPLLVLSALLLYVAAPMAFRGPIPHWYTYPRYATFVLAGLLLAPSPSFAGRRALVLLPGVVAALAMHLSVARAFRAFGDRTRPLLDIIAAVPVGVRVLPLEYVDTDPGLKVAPLAHVHSYITAVKRTYDPHIFDDPSTPVHYREGLTLRRIPWSGPQGFSLAKYGNDYDYVLVQGGAEDPMKRETPPPHTTVRLVVESGMWRLYALERP